VNSLFSFFRKRTVDLLDSLWPLLAFWFFLAPAEAALLRAPTILKAPLCREVFQESALNLGDFFSVKTIFGDTKSYVKIEVDMPTLPSKIIEIQKSSSALKNWTAQQLDTSQGSYLLFNVGYRRLDADFEQTKKILVQEAKENGGFHRNFEIRFTEEALETRSKLKGFRWLIHDKVIETYRKVKGYISEFDFQWLVAFNHLRSSSDVLALSKNIGKPVSQMTEKELQENAVLTIQVSYPELRMHDFPSMNDLMGSAGTLIPYRYLPFTLRVKKAGLEDFLDQMWHDFKGKRLVEIARYVKFQKKISPVAHARLLLEAVNLAEQNNAEVLIASTDTKTAQLFTSKYKFKVYQEMPAKTDEPEFLISIEVGSSDYIEFKKNLEEASKLQEETTVSF